MADGKRLDLWSRVDYDLVLQLPDSEASSTQAGRRPHWRWKLLVLDTFGSLFWVYWVTQAFVADVDRLVFGHLSEYRFFFFVAIAAVIAILVRNTWLALGAYLYVLGFPLVIVVWKLPRWFYKNGSAVTFLACTGLVVGAFTGLRQGVVSFAVFCCVVLCATVGGHAVAPLGIGLALALIAQTIFRTIRRSVQPTRFVEAQKRVITKFVRSQAMEKLLTPVETLTNPDIEKFSPDQQAAFLQGLGNAVLINRGVSYWAYQLERYRRSSAGLILGCALYLWLVVRSVVLLTLVNWTIYRSHHAAFAFQTAPGFLTMTRYTVAGLYGASINGLDPASTGANALSVVTWLIGGVMLLGLFASVFLAFRASRDEDDIRDLAKAIRAEGKRLDERFHDSYEISVAEAIERLDQFKYALVGFLAKLALHIPRDLDDE